MIYQRTQPRGSRIAEKLIRDRQSAASYDAEK